mmetsp:Transcript_3777/g.11176  ORF Transcript_3777/g.11176 Transcript_3777/m.11176 type:complete len:712 (-) Transcript_3777:183-2318(-)|eukprot:CAMPEP_0119265550 /NCGR_PEP_ID=MMETSP1329-20130426/4337_1 /TAXON_ID=114041 /ORGANISM="Genus nov. species nov., Strain RCC1024" /LENGTH=711 /DNA_ID=CAMNT_0007265383 /DNA_START=94 /DNA_END=2229 /DNA_ORIENTATION=+
MRVSLLVLATCASATRLRGASVEDGALAELEAEEESAHSRRLASCTNLAVSAGVPRSKSVSGRIKKYTALWSKAEMQPLMDLMTQDVAYAMTFRATSTCPDDVVVGFRGGGGWMKMVVDAGSNNVWQEQIDDCKSVTDGRVDVFSSQTAWEYGGGSSESDRRRLATGWPTCTLSITNLKVYENSCYSAPPPSPTPSPTQAPTTSTTTTLPITPMTYFTWLFAGVIQPLIPHILVEETPIQIRHTSIIDAINWNCAATYSATYKDALTKVRPTLVAPAHLYDTDVRARCMLAGVDHFTRVFLTGGRAEIRAQCANFGVALHAEDDATIQTACPNLNAASQRLGDPNAFYQVARDEACLAGVAAAASWDYKTVGPLIAEKVMGYGAVDGWNALGDVGRDGTPCTANCRHFRDTTNYQPKDPAQHPNTWQPLLEDKGDGFFYRQEHVTPHIGTRAKFRVLPETERAARVAPAPNYDYAAETELVLARLRSLTDGLKMQVEFHDSKLDILLYCFTALLQSGAFPSLEMALAFLAGYTGAEHDALIVAWKEKVRYDLVRPTTKIQEADPDADIQCYGGPDYRATKTIKAKDFQPYKRVMPHSEYPSGSACLCRGVRDYVDAFLAAKGRSTALPISVPYAAGSSVQEPGHTPAAPLSLDYADMTELAAACSASRLDGGMHFTASTSAAEALCDGIGTAGFAYANDLIGGNWNSVAGV